jgi:hypothetical protein
MDEDIKQENAAELGHMLNHIPITNKQTRKKISIFLKRNDHESPEAYNKKIMTLKTYLVKIPNHYHFLRSLKVLQEPPPPWNPNDPIEKTPKDHFLNASYKRILLKTCCRRRDPHLGRPLPLLFDQGTMLVYNETPIIGRPDRVYSVIKYFGYDFPDILLIEGMEFKLLEVYNMTCPKPFVTNAENTVLYRNYLNSLKN